MVKNMGKIDRVVRIVLAAAVAVLYFTGRLTGTAALVLGILAAVFLATAVVGTCPLYLPFKISTKKKG
jgi:K+-transporting ATPase A subunit